MVEPKLFYSSVYKRVGNPDIRCTITIMVQKLIASPLIDVMLGTNLLFRVEEKLEEGRGLAVPSPRLTWICKIC